MEKLGRRILQNPDYLLKNPRILEKNKRATDRRDVEKHEEFPLGPIPQSLLRL
jgi:hypothetical protein